MQVIPFLKSGQVISIPWLCLYSTRDIQVFLMFRLLTISTATGWSEFMNLAEAFSTWNDLNVTSYVLIFGPGFCIFLECKFIVR